VVLHALINTINLSFAQNIQTGNFQSLATYLDFYAEKWYIYISIHVIWTVQFGPSGLHKCYSTNFSYKI